MASERGEGVLLRILGGSVPLGPLSADLISDQKMTFFTLVFRPCLETREVDFWQVFLD